MSDLKIDLSSHTDKFAAGSRELSIEKKINFIFGKNGTGKTTIADEIATQFADDYSVHVFEDFDGVAINERLDAVALGTENAEIQKQIDIVVGEISDINKDIENPEDDTENLFTKASSTRKALTDQQKKIEDFCIGSAQRIKNLSNPNVASPNYDKNVFKGEIRKAITLTSEEVSTNKDTIKADKKPDIIPVTLPVIELGSYLKSTNEVLEASVKQPVSISELNDNPNKQQFAKTGLEIHDHKQGEVCAFCGNEISNDRWVALGNYFNSEVKKLELRIETGITKIKDELKKIDAIKGIDEHAYYGKYTEQIAQLNTSIKLRKAEYKAYLKDLEKALNEKTNNIFAKTETLSIGTPEDYSGAQKEYSSLVKDTNAFSKNLADEQNNAKDVLRFHEIQKRLETFKYTEENTSLALLSKLNDAAQKDLQDKKDELTKKQLERADLISKTKDEEKIAVKISGLLKGMGFTSFKLKLVDDEDEDQKGQYQIKGHDGNIRPVTALSKGEKNIIAFLYFIFDLDRTDSDNKPKIVVLDDPMTSNDDTMQYIMIGEIQKYYKGLKGDNYFLLLTHNTHFYLNVRPDERTKFKVKDKDGNKKEVSRYEKYGHYRLMSDGKLASIFEISKGRYDFKTNYELLWKELVFLFESDAPDLMLNPCRKICETYTHFMKKDTGLFYKKNSNAKKLFDVNQHAIDDLEAEQNGKTKEEIKKILYELFKTNGAEEHFLSYWKGNL